MFRIRPDHRVNVIGHDDPGRQVVALTGKVLHRTDNKLCHFRLAQPARAQSGVKQRFDLVAIPRQQLLFFVPSERTFRGTSLFENGLTLVLEPRDFVSGQGIGQAESDEVNCSLAFKMWQSSAEMQTGYKTVWAVFLGVVLRDRAHDATKLQDTIQEAKRRVGVTVAAGILPAVEQ